MRYQTTEYIQYQVECPEGALYKRSHPKVLRFMLPKESRDTYLWEALLADPKYEKVCLLISIYMDYCTTMRSDPIVMDELELPPDIDIDTLPEDMSMDQVDDLTGGLNLPLPQPHAIEILSDMSEDTIDYWLGVMRTSIDWVVDLVAIVSSASFRYQNRP